MTGGVESAWERGRLLLLLGTGGGGNGCMRRRSSAPSLLDDPRLNPLPPLAPSAPASYLHYIRRQNPLPPIPPSASTLPSAYLSARLSITQAYEFALSHVGLDPLSAPIWREYLAFVREGETRSQWEEQGKVSEYRGVVGRAVRVPMDGLEDIWREYDQFEGQVNRVTVRSRFLSVLSRARGRPKADDPPPLRFSAGQEVPRRTLADVHDLAHAAQGGARAPAPRSPRCPARSADPADMGDPGRPRGRARLAGVRGLGAVQPVWI